MKIPENMTEHEVLEIIEEIAKVLAPQNQFDSYDVDDIKQEIFLICCDGLERYDGIRPLNNFLFVHTTNRLKNLKRDKFIRRLSKSRSREDIDKSNESYSYEHEPFKHIDDKDELESFLKKLPPNISSDLSRIVDGVKLPQRRKASVFEYIEKVLNDQI